MLDHLVNGVVVASRSAPPLPLIPPGNAQCSDRREFQLRSPMTAPYRPGCPSPPQPPSGRQSAMSQCGRRPGPVQRPRPGHADQSWAIPKAVSRLDAVATGPTIRRSRVQARARPPAPGSESPRAAKRVPRPKRARVLRGAAARRVPGRRGSPRASPRSGSRRPCRDVRRARRESCRWRHHSPATRATLTACDRPGGSGASFSSSSSSTSSRRSSPGGSGTASAATPSCGAGGVTCSRRSGFRASR